METKHVAALRHRGVRFLIAGQTVSDFGNAMFLIALVGLIEPQRPALLGLLLGVRGVATAVFGLPVGALVNRFRTGHVLVVCEAGDMPVVLGYALGPRSPGGLLPYPLVLLALAETLPQWTILVGYVLVGIGFMMFGVYWCTGLQTSIPADRLAVVFSVDQVGSFGLQPCGHAAAGIAATWFGASAVLVFASGFGLVTTLVSRACPACRRSRIHRRRPSPR